MGDDSRSATAGFASAMDNFAAIEARLAARSTNGPPPPPPPLPTRPPSPPPPSPPPSPLPSPTPAAAAAAAAERADDAQRASSQPSGAAGFFAAMDNFAAIEARLADRRTAHAVEVDVVLAAVADAGDGTPPPPPPHDDAPLVETLAETIGALSAARARRETELLRVVQDFRKLTRGAGSIDASALRTLLPLSVDGECLFYFSFDTITEYFTLI